MPIQKNPLAPPLPRGLEQSGTETVPGTPNATSPAVVSAASIIAGKMPMVQVSSPASPVQHARPETIESQIVAYYYAALTNLLCQVHLPPVRQVEDNDAVKALIETSYRDFHAIDSWLSTLDPDEIRLSAGARSYREVRDGWRQHVKDWRMISNGSRNGSWAPAAGQVTPGASDPRLDAQSDDLAAPALEQNEERNELQL